MTSYQKHYYSARCVRFRTGIRGGAYQRSSTGILPEDAGHPPDGGLIIIQTAQIKPNNQAVQTTASNLYKEKKIRGFCHLYSGQVRILITY